MFAGLTLPTTLNAWQIQRNEMPVKNTTNTLDELQTDVSKVVSEGLKERKKEQSQADRSKREFFTYLGLSCCWFAVDWSQHTKADGEEDNQVGANIDITYTCLVVDGTAVVVAADCLPVDLNERRRRWTSPHDGQNIAYDLFRSESDGVVFVDIVVINRSECRKRDDDEYLQDEDKTLFSIGRIVEMMIAVVVTVVVDDVLSTNLTREPREVTKSFSNMGVRVW